MPKIETELELCERAEFNTWQPFDRSIKKEGVPLFISPAVRTQAESDIDISDLMSAIRNYPKVLEVMKKIVAYRAVYMAYAEKMVRGEMTELGDFVLDDASAMFEIFDLLKRHNIS